jgi:hypothetical protein
VDEEHPAPTAAMAPNAATTSTEDLTMAALYRKSFNLPLDLSGAAVSEFGAKT